MARFSSQTPRSLSRHFKRGTEMSPIKFLEHVKVKLACDRLLSGMPMTRVLRTTGFGDAQRLNRAFHRVLGISAAAYQRQFISLIPNFKSIAPDGINSHWLSGPLHLMTGRFQSTCALG
jgi:transcriptional regulator GlxA family with amidase domain